MAEERILKVEKLFREVTPEKVKLHPNKLYRLVFGIYVMKTEDGKILFFEGEVKKSIREELAEILGVEARKSG